MRREQADEGVLYFLVVLKASWGLYCFFLRYLLSLKQILQVGIGLLSSCFTGQARYRNMTMLLFMFVVPRTPLRPKGKGKGKAGPRLVSIR